MIKLLAVIAGSCIVLVGLLYLMQRSIIFPAPAGELLDALPAGVEHVPLGEGHAFLVKPDRSMTPAPLVVFAHGNAELAQWSLGAFDALLARGFAILLLEYPGYAGTKGSPSAMSIEAAALEALDAVTGRAEIDETRVIAYGRSIGSGAACAIARHRSVAALILESPFYSLKDLVAEKGFPSFLLRDEFDNAAAVAASDAPVFLYHGVNDQLIPITHSERLQAQSEKAVLVRERCGHNDCPRPWPELFVFLERLGLLALDDDAGVAP